MLLFPFFGNNSVCPYVKEDVLLGMLYVHLCCNRGVPVMLVNAAQLLCEALCDACRPQQSSFQDKTRLIIFKVL